MSTSLLSEDDQLSNFIRQLGEHGFENDMKTSPQREGNQVT